MSTTQVVQEGVDLGSFEDKNLPTDVHLIAFTPTGGKQQVDAVRAYTMVDIFDRYYDKHEGKVEIHYIKSGYGKIKPKLYGKIVTESDEWLNEKGWIQKRAVRLYRQAARQADCQTNTNIDIKLCTMQN